MLSTRTRHAVAALTVVAAIGLSTAACSTSNTSKCSNGTCTVTLKGKGATIRLTDTKKSEVTFTLKDAADEKATLGVGDGTGSCSAGEDVTIGEVAIHCDEVKADELSFTVGS